MTRVIRAIPTQVFEFAVDPTVNDDESQGYAVNDRWTNTLSEEEFVLTNATAGAAVWKSTTSASGELTSGIIFNSRYTTPVITSDQDDYSIANLNTYNIVVWRSNKDIDVTGIDSSSLNNYYAYLFINGNTNGKKVKFKKNDSSSSQANRIDSTNDIELNEGEFWWFVYSTDRNRWIAQAKL